MPFYYNMKKCVMWLGRDGRVEQEEIVGTLDRLDLVGLLG